jgi:hypothetical protein
VPGVGEPIYPVRRWKVEPSIGAKCGTACSGRGSLVDDRNWRRLRRRGMRPPSFRGGYDVAAGVRSGRSLRSLAEFPALIAVLIARAATR